MTHHILLVEDDPEIRQMLRNCLIQEQYQVTCAADGKEACDLFARISFHLVLLDLRIPKVSGLEVLAYIRQRSVVPVLILSAKDSEGDKTLGLGLGADDYITKPFSIAEVLARIHANIRRTVQYDAPAPVSAPPLTAGDLVLSPCDHTLTKVGQPVDLTAKEFDILRLLMEHPKRVFTKAQLYNLVWQDPYCGDENAVNVHISRLRSKLEDNPRSPRYILTVWGIGYKLGEAL